MIKADDAKWMKIFDATECFINVRKFEKRLADSSAASGFGVAPEDSKGTIVLSD